MAWDDIPRINCFSLSDFTSYRKCLFAFLVKHHLQKKYDLEEGSEAKTIGSLLDLAIKKLHASKAYHQPLDYLLSNLFKAAEVEIREQAKREGPNSYYGPTVEYLNQETIDQAREVFKNYYLKRGGRINRSLPYKRFWEYILEGEKQFKIWGGPDALEIGDDGIPEVVDYKYLSGSGKENLDRDLMPKVYTLLCASELLKLGYEDVRFRVRLWNEPLDESLYDDFDLKTIENLKNFFRLEIQEILDINRLSFCERPYCKACNSDQRQSWISELQSKFNLS